MKHPEITWSLMHPTPLDPDYVRKLVKKASEYLGTVFLSADHAARRTADWIA